MTIADKQIDDNAGLATSEPAVSTQPRTRTSCVSYRKAKNLAASRRRSGDQDAYAVYNVALGSWCV